MPPTKKTGRAGGRAAAKPAARRRIKARQNDTLASRTRDSLQCLADGVNAMLADAREHRLAGESRRIDAALRETEARIADLADLAARVAETLESAERDRVGAERDRLGRVEREIRARRDAVAAMRAEIQGFLAGVGFRGR